MTGFCTIPSSACGTGAKSDRTRSERRRSACEFGHRRRSRPISARKRQNEKAGRPMIPNAARPFDFALGESADMIRDSARNFAEKEIAPRAAAIDRDNLFPRDLWPKMGALGLHGITAPEEYGGLGLGYLEHCVAMEEVSRASRLRRPLLRRAFEPLRQPDRAQRQCRAEEALPAEAHLRRARRRPRHVGAQRRLRRRVDDHARREEGRPLDTQRHEDVDHQRPGRRDA